MSKIIIIGSSEYMQFLIIHVIK